MQQSRLLMTCPRARRQETELPKSPEGQAGGEEEEEAAEGLQEDSPLQRDT